MSVGVKSNQVDKVISLLNFFEVQYILIGGVAMAVTGFPRYTKDIDLVLPVNAENNQRLMAVLAALQTETPSRTPIDLNDLNAGFSTAYEGDVVIDLLFVAASKTYEDLKPFIIQVPYGQQHVTTLDIDGLLLTKNTNRASDIPDRLKLGMLKNKQASPSSDFEP